jgi:hypothetical protein
MPIDPSIALGVKPIQIDSPVNQLANVLQIQGAQQANQLNTLKLQSAQRDQDQQNKLMQAMGTLGADATDEQRSAVLKGLGRYDLSDNLDKSINERAKTKSEAQWKGTESTQKVIGLYRDNVGSLTDPAQAAQFVQAMHSDPALKDSPINRVPLDAAIAQIPQDPEGFARWKQTFALGATKFMELNKPTQTVLNNGGTNQVIQTPGLGGAPQTVGNYSITESANNAANNATTRRGQNMVDARSRESNSAALSKPFEVTGADGQPMLVQQDRQGRITPVDGYAPKQAPLKQIPAMANTAIITNNQSMQRIDDALRLLGGQNIGNPAEGQLKGDTAATGWKGYLPNGVLNRVDPQGVDTRAIISDIGSLKLHDRSGAAVTASESPRLMPFIPLSTDDHETVVKKLNGLRTALVTEQQALNDTYSKDQGYRPSGVKPRASGGNDIHAQADAILNGGK